MNYKDFGITEDQANLGMEITSEMSIEDMTRMMNLFKEFEKVRNKNAKGNN